MGDCPLKTPVELLKEENGQIRATLEKMQDTDVEQTRRLGEIDAKLGGLIVSTNGLVELWQASRWIIAFFRLFGALVFGLITLAGVMKSAGWWPWK